MIMKRSLKYGLIFIGAILVVFLALIALVAATFNPNDYKPLIVNLVQEKKQRTLKLEGDIKLTFFPRIGADFGKISLSEHGSNKEFAAIASARVSLAVLPLLKKQLVVDRIQIDGIRARLVRYPDGSTNIDDLLKKDESEQFKFDIEGVSVTRAALSFDDRMTGQKLDISGMEFESGRLANNQPGKIDLKFTLQGDNPKIDVQVALASGLLFDTEAKALTLDALTVSLSGKRGVDGLDIRLTSPKFELGPERFVGGVDLTAKLIQPPKGNLDLVLSVPALTGKGRAVRADNFTLDIIGQQGDNTIKSRVASPFSANLDTRQFSLDKLVASLKLSSPAMPRALNMNLGGAARLDFARQDAHLYLSGKLDGSPLKARLGMSNFGAPAYSFDIVIDRLDVDRYLPPGKPENKVKRPEKPLDFGFLKNLNVSGQFSIAALKVANIKSSNIKLKVQ